MTTEPKERKASPLGRLPKLTKVSWRDLATALGPVVGLSAIAILIALHFVRPAPPSTLTMSSGPDGSTFRANADKYAEILSNNGITLKVLPSKGSLENLNRLLDENFDTDIALVPSGIAGTTDITDLVSLGSVFYQPILIFYSRPKPLMRLSELKGKRIAIGPEGSGTRFLALALLKANEIEPNGPTQLVPLEGKESIGALLAHKVDAIVVTGDSAAPANIRELLHNKSVRLFDFPQADAYVRRFRYLTKLEIPAGAFDLGENLPPRPLTMLATTVELVARWDLHPALSDLLIEAAREVHGHAGLLQNAGEFPAPLPHEYPISDDAARFYRSGKGIVYRHFPFWLASLADRALVVLVPILVVLIPGLRLVPTLYGWRIRNRIYRHYGALMALERASLSPLSPEQREELLKKLGDIENSVITLQMPGAYADQIYVLRQHITFVHQKLAQAS